MVSDMMKSWKLAVIAVGAIALTSSVPHLAKAEAPAAPTESQQRASAILLQMAEFLSRAEKFSVEIIAAHDVVQDSGQKIEFGETGTIAVSRPNHLRGEFEASDGARQRVIFDGATITIEHEQAALYAQATQPGTVDQTIVHFVRDLEMRLPLAPLLMQTLSAELQRRVATADYVELTNIFGMPTHHIAARTQTVDFQVWIADGEEPVPVRIVLSYPGAAGHPSFRAQFSHWNFAPEFANDTFSFAPAPDAERIPFVSELRGVAAENSQLPPEGAGQ